MLNLGTETTRRSFMAAGGLGAALALVQSTPAQAASLSDVEKAQQGITNTAKRLEDEGKIIIARGGGGEALV